MWFLLGALFGALVGVVMVLNRDLLERRQIKRKPMATRTDLPSMYGKSKIEWFWRRAYDEDKKLASLPLRDYAKHYSSH